MISPFSSNTCSGLACAKPQGVNRSLALENSLTSKQGKPLLKQRFAYLLEWGAGASFSSDVEAGAVVASGVGAAGAIGIGVGAWTIKYEEPDLTTEAFEWLSTEESINFNTQTKTTTGIKD